MGGETGTRVIANDACRMAALGFLTRQGLSPNAFMWAGLPGLLPGIDDDALAKIHVNHRADPPPCRLGH